MILDCVDIQAGKDRWQVGWRRDVEADEKIDRDIRLSRYAPVSKIGTLDA
jgi:hypothetical protein